MTMMDRNLQFSNAQAITATASSYVLDLATGLMDTSTTFDTNPAISAGPNLTSKNYFGEDLGMGPVTPRVIVQTGSTAAGTGTSLAIDFQGAPMNSTAAASGLLSDLTFATYISTGTIALALLTAYTRIASFDWPMRKIAESLPRFVKLLYTVAGSNFTTLTVTADVTLVGSDALATVQKYPSGFKVGA